MKRLKTRNVIVGGVLILGFVGAVGVRLYGDLLLKLLPDREVPQKDGAHLDDFNYKVTAVRESSREGTHTAPVGKSFYIVSTHVDNQAKIVDYRYSPSLVRAYDPAGNELLQIKALQKELGDQEAVISAGSSFNREIAFIGPSGMKRLKVRFAEDGFGEVLDALLGARQFIIAPVIASGNLASPSKRTVSRP